MAKLVSRTGLLGLIGLGLGSFCLCACGTLASSVSIGTVSDPSSRPCYYSGVIFDAHQIAEGVTGHRITNPRFEPSTADEDTSTPTPPTAGGRLMAVGYFTLDLPFSFAADTVLLPVHAGVQFLRFANSFKPVQTKLDAVSNSTAPKE